MEKKIKPYTRTWHSSRENEDFDFLKGCNELFDCPKVIGFGESFIKISRFSMLRNIFTMEATGSNKCLRDILINYIDNANQIAPGAGAWLPRLILNDSELISKGRLSTADAVKHTVSMLGHEKAKSIIKLLPEVISNTGKIIVQSHKGFDDIMEVTTGYKFAPTLSPGFSKILGTTDLFLHAAKILVIEGSPSTVGEITRLLEWCIQENENLILIAKSFPEDIISTLAINWVKGNLNIVPMVYGDRLENINLPADLIAVCAGLPVTPAMGDTLAMKLEEKMGKATNIRVSKESLIVSGHRDPRTHVNTLYEKLKQVPDYLDEQKTMLADRLAGLSNELLIIKLSESRDLQIIREELDIAISYYSFMCYSAAKIKVDNKFYIVPLAVYETAMQMAEEYKSLRQKIGGFLLIKN